MEHKHTNSLINETSPYLLQHAHNPVNWYAWNKEVFELAKKEDKPVLVSIGYSACHWCHVMEHESFEDEPTAALMNDLFINIKVDREERPDVDQIYMTAVQLMTGRGGWPLNCIVLPDGRPIYGGTYFPKQQWQNILLNVADLWKKDRNKVLDYAAQLTEGVKRTELIVENKAPTDFTFEILRQTVNSWKLHFDAIEGGSDREPKFPLPNNYQFLLRYATTTHSASVQQDREEVMQHVELTLKKMAFGGIYDQVGGGFARYSTDKLWKVPHFEKMLYDNAQLVSLYSEAYLATENKLYKDIVYETIQFIQRELTSPEGAFYSALDADTEGEEGKYYVWTKAELQTVLGDKFELAAAYFNINSLGYWEHDNYVLMRNKSDIELAKRLNITTEQLKVEIQQIKKDLLLIREKRVKPGLDDKSLTSWNALMITGLIDAYTVFDEKFFLDAAVKNAELITTKQLKADGSLWHSYKSGRSTINGFLEDYAFTIEAFVALYQATFKEEWLGSAKKLMDYCIAHFYDSKSGMFYFTSDIDAPLIARKIEVSDNVTPASCSSIAKSLFTLSHYYGNTNYLVMSKKMLNNVLPNIIPYGSGYSNWCMLLLHFTLPFYEVAIVGNHVDEKKKTFSKLYLPNVIFAGSSNASQIPLLQNRHVEGKTLIYICENSTCKKPVENINDAILLLQSE